MLTFADLADAMEKSGRRLTPRTARNWWTVGILPRPQRTGLGRSRGTVSFWRDRRVITQAQIAHDLLDRGISLRGTAAGLWLLGFPTPLEIVRAAFTEQIADHYQRSRGRSRDGLEAGLWHYADRFVRMDARTRGGSAGDDEGVALYALTGELLELFFGVDDSGQEARDTAAELVFQFEALRPFTTRYGTNDFPVLKAKPVKDVVTWVREIASLRRQRDAVIGAQPHDWVRARRIVRLAIGLPDRADAAASPKQHEANLHLFARLAVGWARLSFPILLAVARTPKQRRPAICALFAAAAIVRKGPQLPTRAIALTDGAVQ